MAKSFRLMSGMRTIETYSLLPFSGLNSQEKSSHLTPYLIRSSNIFRSQLKGVVFSLQKTKGSDEFQLI